MFDAHSARGSGSVGTPRRAPLPFPAPRSASRLPSQVSEEKQLIERALSGDAAAVAALVRELLAVIQRRVARALVLSGRCRAEAIGQEVEDLTQDILLLLFTGDSPLRAWEPDKGLSIKNFVGLIAQRRVLAVLASRRRSPFAADPTDPKDLGNLTETRQLAQQPNDGRLELERLALQLRERLSPLGLEMFYRLYVWQQDPGDIATATGQQAAAVYQWRSRIRKLALSLRKEEEEPARSPQGVH